MAREENGMANFLYLSDVFCPWCYGFGPVLDRLCAEHPDLPARVLGGNLMPEPVSLAQLQEDSPRVRDFFLRLEKTTGRPVSAFLRLLERRPDLCLHSPAISVPLAALKRLAPGQALPQMEAFQESLYGRGEDVLSRSVQHALAARWNVRAADFDQALAQDDTQERARCEAQEAAALMGELRLYPTLFLEQGQKRLLLARGYAPYATVKKALAAALAGTSDQAAQGVACGLDGQGCC